MYNRGIQKLPLNPKKLKEKIKNISKHDNNIENRLYDPVEDEFMEHVAGWNDQVEYDEDGEEEEENRRVVTIARFVSSHLVLSVGFL